ncbi:MAG: signal recognition particle protein Srp19, partial [Candidatus Aenigmatarchaeota archaeon]
ARWFKIRGLSVGLVACDMHRAAAQEQLIQLAEKIGINVYTEGKDPESIAKNALKKAKESVLIFDSAGRDALDKELAQELKELKDIIKPDEIFLVVPADIGQDAGRQASEFNRLVGITGIIVTKLDGTAKGGGALSSSAVSGAKVKFIGTGERLEDLEVYDPKRFVSRLIGYGDIQGLLERAKEVGIDEESAKKMIERFTLEDFVNQISQVRKMGSLSRITEMIPGFSNLKIPTNVLDVQEERMKKWEHIVKSMTPEERENPDIINFSRVKRIARGSGTSESEVRNLLKNYKQVRKLMKMTKTGGLRRGMLGRFARQFGLKV